MTSSGNNGWQIKFFELQTHSLAALHSNAKQFYRPGTQVTSSRVSQVTGDRVQDCPEEDAVLKPHVKIQIRVRGHAFLAISLRV